MGVQVLVDGTPVTLDTRLWSWDATFNPVAPNSYIGCSRTDPIEIFRTQRSVRMVVGFLARNIAQVAVHAYTTDTDGDRWRVPSARTLPRLLKEPSSTTTAFEFMRQLVTDICLFDRYASRIVAVNGRIEVRRMPPNLWAFKRNADGSPNHVLVIDENGRAVRVELSDLLWFDGFPCDKDTSPLQALAALIDEERESDRYRTEIWRNGGRFGGWIGRPLEAPDWTRKPDPNGLSGRQSFKAGWRGFASGGGREGETPILEEGMTYHELENGMTPESAQQLETRKFSLAETMAAFWVPGQLLGVLDGNFSNVSAYRELLYSDTLGPWFQELQQGINARLLPHPLVSATSDVFVEFTVGEKLRMAFEDQARILQTATGGPIMTRNEARRLLNLPSIDGGDELIVPLNVLTGGQASPTDSGSQNQGGQ